MAEGARLESVFRLTPNEGSNPSLSASLNEKGPRFCVGLFHLIRRARSWFEPLVRQIRRERIWTRFSAARRASTTDGAGNPSLSASLNPQLCPLALLFLPTYKQPTVALPCPILTPNLYSKVSTMYIHRKGIYVHRHI